MTSHQTQTIHAIIPASSEGTYNVAVISARTDYLSSLQSAKQSLLITHEVNLEEDQSLKLAAEFEEIINNAANQIGAVHLYLETIEDVATLSRSALKAARTGIPIVVVRGGRSHSGRRVIGPSNDPRENGPIDALFDRLGFIECSTLNEAVETLKMLVYGGRPLGRKLAVYASNQTNAVLSADIATTVGLDVPELEKSISAYIKPLMLPSSSPDNPLNITARLKSEAENRTQILKSFLAGNADMAVQVVTAPFSQGNLEQQEQIISQIKAFTQVATNLSMPCAVINSALEPFSDKLKSIIIKNGAAPLQGLKNSFKGIINTVRFVEQMILMAQMPAGAVTLPKPSNLIGSIQLDEVECKRRLYKAGVKVPNAVVVEGSEMADLNSLTFPVVLKAVSADLTHKSELGAVKLSIHSEEQLRQTLFNMNDIFDSVNLRGFLIEEMVTDGLGELLVGVRHVPNIGQVLTLAFGGTSVELLGDVKTLILPASSAEIELTLRSLRLFPTIEGWRGKPAADISQVVESIALICNYAQSQQENLVALEVNPLIVRPAGNKPVAADAVFQISQ